MATRIIVMLVALACGDAGTVKPAQPGCYVSWEEDIQAVSCTGEACLVCSRSRCRTFLLGDCR